MVEKCCSSDFGKWIGRWLGQNALPETRNVLGVSKKLFCAHHSVASLSGDNQSANLASKTNKLDTIHPIALLLEE